MRTWAIVVGTGVATILLYTMLDHMNPPAALHEKTEPDLFAFVRSMEGTRPDGAVSVDIGDQLVVDAELGRLFDYYLARLGETSLAAIRSQIEAELERRLKPAHAREAKRLLGAYLDYRQALVAVEESLPSSADMLAGVRLRQQAMRQLRANYFTPKESEGLFGAEDSYDNDAVARMEVMSDTSLSEAQQVEKLAILDRQMPPALLAEREAPQKVLKLEEAVLALRATGAGENEVYRLRATTFSPEAAARLAEVDRAEGQWQQRIRRYQEERKWLLADHTAEQAAEPLQRLRDAQFLPHEQLRLDAYE
jgi:lipase chaperone LimK